MTQPADGILTFWVDPKYTQGVPAHDGCAKRLNTETCDSAKNVATAVVAALAALVIVFTTLVIIAQQLGICADLASLLQPKMAYLTLATGVLVLAADAVLMISLTRSYLDKLYTDQELTAQSFRHHIDVSQIWELMPEGSCWDAVFPSSKPHHPPAYVVLRKAEGCRFIHAFKLLSDQQDCLRQQIEEKGLRDAKAEFEQEDEYPLSFITQRFAFDPVIARSFDQAAFPILNAKVDDPRFYECQTVAIPASTEQVMIVRRNHGTLKRPNMVTHLYKAAAFKKLYGRGGQHATLLNRDEIARVVFEEGNKVVKAKLEKGEFWTFEIKVNKTKLYCVRYLLATMLDMPVMTQFFLDKKDIGLHLDSMHVSGSPEWIDAKQSFNLDLNAPYGETYVRANVNPVDIQAIKDWNNVGPNEARWTILRTRDHKEIGAVKLRVGNGPPEIYYYQSRDALRTKLLALGIDQSRHNF